MSADVIQLPLKRRHGLDEGDAVRLKSGGPIMLVAIADAEVTDDVECVWASGRRLASHTFPAAVLELLMKGGV